jgi:hypothetical protein
LEFVRRCIRWGCAFAVMRPLASLLALALTAAPCAAQSFQAALSRDTVQMGDVFELRVRVPVPPGSIVHFPDTVARTEVLESHAPVRWEAEETPGGALLTLTYSVIAWGAGLVPVSGFDVFVSPSGALASEAPTLPGGSHVGDWENAPTRGGDAVRPLRVPRRGVWVTPVFSEEQMEVGVDPMPAADVVGASWHWPSVLFGSLFAGTLAVLALRAWRRSAATGARRTSPGWTPSASRREALAQLDELLAERLSATVRTHELYTRSSAIVRRFVGRMEPLLGADLTSSELMGALRARSNGHANGRRGSALSREMSAAEVVKFGQARPDAGEAEAHLVALREWVAECGDSL